MSATLIAPEYELFPNRYRWTVAECYQMADEGRLTGRYEILDGEIVNKMGQNAPHRIAVVTIANWLRTIFDPTQVQVQGPIAMTIPDGEYSEPEPDIVVTKESNASYNPQPPGPQDLILVVEVSDTTIRTDLLFKSALYARSRIKEYWVLDVNLRRLHIHRQPLDGEYTLKTEHAEAEVVSLVAYPDTAVTVAELLPPTL